ncbi:MAG: polyprenyl synthetase family protein [Ruminococcus sp.]|jgi:geranylgeranyl diphosphate synthase type II|nr:polyprenyl synthetase family protein [Ruminococcus sp.]
MSKFEEKMAQYIKLTEENLLKYNDHTEANAPQKELIDAMNYSLEAGGKRVRPALVYAFCEALGGNIESAIAPACAIEMIHTFSLIHDDLPAMDNDDFRRGKPSCHKAYGEAMAILAGDALSVLPFEIIADSPDLTADQKVLIISVLANSVGRDGMIGGQVIDMLNEERSDVTEDELRNMYRCKTGQLIAVSAVMGAICADASRETLRSAAEYGLRLGLAFQIIDDILDVTSTQEELGKPIGSDERENKTTFVTLFGLEKAIELADKATSEAIEWLDAIEDNAFLKELTEKLLRRKN